MNSKLIPKAFLGIRFGKSPVEKAYENDREIALAAAYGDLMNDKKARKWAEKDYDKKWANSSNRKNFQYEYQVTDLDNKLAQLRAENDKIVSDFTKTVNHNYDIFNPKLSKVEDAVDWLAIGAQQMPDNTPRKFGDYRSNSAWQKQANDLGFTDRDEVRAYQTWAGLTSDGAAGSATQSMLRTQGKSLADFRKQRGRQTMPVPDQVISGSTSSDKSEYRIVLDHPLIVAARKRRISGRDLMNAFDQLGTYGILKLPNNIVVRRGYSNSGRNEYSTDGGKTYKEFTDYVKRRDRRGNPALNKWYD